MSPKKPPHEGAPHEKPPHEKGHEPPHERGRGPEGEPTHRDIVERLDRIEEVVRRLDEKL